MRRLWLILALLAVSVPAQCALLQEGWYVQPSQVFLYFMGDGELYENNWWPIGPEGTYGNVQVEKIASIVHRVTILNDVMVPAGTVLWEDYGYINSHGYSRDYEAMEVIWKANYDPTQVRFSAYMVDTGGHEHLFWYPYPYSGGPAYGSDNRGIPYPDDGDGFQGIVFRLETLPEPSTLICLATGIALVSLRWRRVR